MSLCAKNRKLLNAYIDNELSVRTRHEVERHLTECSVCRFECDGLRGLALVLRNDHVPPTPVGLSARILAEAALRRKGKEAPITSGWGWRGFLFQPWLVRGATAAALVVGLVMGVWMGWTSHRSPGSEQWVTMTTNENMEMNMYAFDVLGAEPRGSIEAATLALLDNGKI